LDKKVADWGKTAIRDLSSRASSSSNQSKTISIQDIERMRNSINNRGW